MTARSKLKNFAPKILLCAGLIVLSVRNANIVSDGKASELGILNFEFLLMQAAKPSGELFSASPAILNYSVVNYSRQGKLRRLWRLAVATHPPIADCLLKGHVSIRNQLQASEVVQLTVGVRDGDENFMSNNKKQGDKS